MNRNKVLFYGTFAIYLLIMVWLLFGQRLDRWQDEYSFARMRENLNIIPFHTIGEFTKAFFRGGKSVAVINLLGNVVMFIPLGFFLSGILGKSHGIFGVLLRGACILAGVEILQLLTLLGSFDVDDLILNLLGVGIGFVFFRCLNKEDKRNQGL